MWPNSSLSISSDGMAAQLDQHAGGGRGDLLDHLPDVADRFGLADHLLAVNFLLEDLVFLGEVGLVRGVLDRDEDAVQVKGFLDEIEGALVHTLDGGGDVGMAGDHDDRRLDAFFHQLDQDFRPFHAGHLDVAENDIIPFFPGQFQALGTVFGYIDRIPFVHQDFFQRIPDRAFVVNYKNLHINRSFGVAGGRIAAASILRKYRIKIADFEQKFLFLSSNLIIHADS